MAITTKGLYVNINLSTGNLDVGVERLGFGYSTKFFPYTNTVFVAITSYVNVFRRKLKTSNTSMRALTLAKEKYTADTLKELTVDEHNTEWLPPISAYLKYYLVGAEYISSCEIVERLKAVPSSLPFVKWEAEAIASYIMKKGSLSDYAVYRVESSLEYSKQLLFLYLYRYTKERTLAIDLFNSVFVDSVGNVKPYKTYLSCTLFSAFMETEECKSIIDTTNFEKKYEMTSGLPIVKSSSEYVLAVPILRKIVTNMLNWRKRQQDKIDINGIRILRDRPENGILCDSSYVDLRSLTDSTKLPLLYTEEGFYFSDTAVLELKYKELRNAKEAEGEYVSAMLKWKLDWRREVGGSEMVKGLHVMLDSLQRNGYKSSDIAAANSVLKDIRDGYVFSAFKAKLIPQAFKR